MRRSESKRKANTSPKYRSMGEQAKVAVVIRKGNNKYVRSVDKPVIYNGTSQGRASHLSFPSSPNCFSSYVGGSLPSPQLLLQTKPYNEGRIRTLYWTKLLASLGICWSKEEALTYRPPGSGGKRLGGGKTLQLLHGF